MPKDNIFKMTLSRKVEAYRGHEIIVEHNPITHLYDAKFTHTSTQSHVTRRATREDALRDAEARIDLLIGVKP